MPEELRIKSFNRTTYLLYIMLPGHLRDLFGDTKAINKELTEKLDIEYIEKVILGCVIHKDSFPRLSNITIKASQGWTEQMIEETITATEKALQEVMSAKTAIN